jgi:flagellar hook-associated protein 3 FlgL
MAVSTIGDMRQQFLTTRHNTAMKNELNTLAQELTTGEVADITSHLGGAQTTLAGVDRQLQMLGQFSQANAETGHLLSVMQTALAGLDSHRETASSTLLMIGASSTPSQISVASSIAASSFEATVQTLNLRSGDRAMFGGNDLDGNPLVNGDDMLATLRAQVTGLTTTSDIDAAIDTWFDAPGGGFETDGYQGDPNGYLNRATAANQTVEIGVRADDQAIRDTLKSLAKGALAGDTTLSLDINTQRELQMKAGVGLLSSASSMAGVQARLGYAQAQVEEAAVRTSAQESSYGIMRNNLVSADPFETATRLQSIQLQLETHYTLTARLSRLSLTEYLR